MALSQWRSMRSGRVSMPCSSRNAFIGDSAEPVLRSGTVRARNECGGPAFARVDDAVLGRLRLVEHRDAVLVLGPRELAGIADDAADRFPATAAGKRPRLHSSH